MNDDNYITNADRDEDEVSESGAAAQQNTSRRKFLKAALIGGAGVAAVGAATAVGLERAGVAPHTGITKIIRYPFVGGSGSPGGATGTACTTGTNSADYVPQSTFGNTEGIFLWGLFTNLPAGTYSVAVSPTIQAEGATCTSTSTPFDYQGSGSAVRIYDLSASSVTWSCSPTAQTQLNTPKFKSSSLSGNSVTVSAGDDLQVQIHMKNVCSGARVVPVTINLFQGSNPTPFLTATTTITITKK